MTDDDNKIADLCKEISIAIHSMHDELSDALEEAYMRGADKSINKLLDHILTDVELFEQDPIVCLNRYVRVTLLEMEKEKHEIYKKKP